MKTFLRHALKPLLVLLVSASVVFAQTPPAPRKAAATQQELDQMLAPIALYPDSLLSQILMASTYPLEVVEAARWSRANPGLKGEEAVNAVEQRDWDASVKSLAAFPQVLAMMDQQLEWTSRLGDVFIAQEPQVMETVQSLRQKAYDAGNLRSTEQAYVVQQGDAIAIEPAAPQVVYVPYYDPRVAYGPWWWPAYPPAYWAPWPGYYAYPGYAAGFSWGPGIIVGAGFFFSSCDWRARHVTVVNVTNVFVNRSGVVNRPGLVRTGQPVIWQHDPGHRRGVPYHIASLQQRFGASTQAGQRRDFRWQDPAPATRNSSLNRPEVHSANPRPQMQGIERPYPRRDGRPDGRSSTNPGAAARPEIRAPMTRPPVAAAPQVHAGPGNVPRMQNPAPQFGAGRGQAANRPGPSAPRAPGEGHSR
ncbi:MAG: DUF3300 domain-containing protein [Betaproteobacteria bacterium]|nr:MAG: DUF3300 domain-containing protein [Betaproteobacteria bacterium]TMH90821.1 MAG: DUF3300 domain-containing protein [Betaproteobacteria bacterium]HXG96578.1 DUF3300 domain-containing protein [Gemmatimonadales bacterium]